MDEIVAHASIYLPLLTRAYGFAVLLPGLSKAPYKGCIAFALTILFSSSANESGSLYRLPLEFALGACAAAPLLLMVSLMVLAWNIVEVTRGQGLAGVENPFIDTGQADIAQTVSSVASGAVFLFGFHLVALNAFANLIEVVPLGSSWQIAVLLNLGSSLGRSTAQGLVSLGPLIALVAGLCLAVELAAAWCARLGWRAPVSQETFFIKCIVLGGWAWWWLGAQGSLNDIAHLIAANG